MSDHAREPQRKPEAPPALTRVRAPMLQRKCTCGGRGGECEECRRKRQRLQRSSNGSPGGAAMPAIVQSVLSSPGRPLDAATRAHMEPRFGTDFSQVRVHDDAQAAQSARAVGAHAYTVGQDIAFAAGHYAPHTPGGQRLLAHELAHTVQQRGLQRSSDGVAVDRGAEYDRLEAEADRAAAAVMAGDAPGFGALATKPILSRATDPTIATAKSTKPKKVTSSKGTHTVKPTEVFTSAEGSIAEYEIDTFFMPAAKGANALPIYQAMAGQSLESTVALVGSGKTKTALWQTRESTADLRSLWLQKVGWTPAAADELWERSGGDKTFPSVAGKVCQMDHIVELQIGGNNTPENIQPLDAKENQSSGGAIKSEIESLAVAIANDKDLGAAAAEQLKLRFGAVKQIDGSTSSGKACSNKKNPTCLDVEACARQLQVVAKEGGGVEIARVDYPVSAGGRPTTLKVPVTFQTRPSEEAEIEADKINAGAATLIPGLMLVKLAHLNKAKTKSDIIAARIDVRDKTRLPLSLDPAADPLTLIVGNQGALALDAKAKKTALGFTYKYLSPGSITEVGLDDTGETYWKGVIRPSVPMLGDLGVEYRKGELLVTKGLDEAALKKRSVLGMRVTKAQVQLQLAPEFKPSGVIELQMGSDSRPLARAALTLEADSIGLIARGKLNVFIPKMETAESEITYLGGADRNEWRGTITIRSEDIKLPGGASLTGGFDGALEKGQIRFSGAVDATFPGGNSARFKLSRDPNTGWVLGGSGTFRVPKVDPVKVDVTYFLAKETLVATGKTGFNIPAIGLTGRLDHIEFVITKNQPVKASGKGGLDFKKGKAEGHVDVVYNPNGKFTGKGSLSYQIRPDLTVKGTVELDEKEKLRITGELVFAKLKLFEGHHPPPRNLFSIGFSIPVPGASVGGVGLKFTITGGVETSFGFGPGVIEPLTIAAGFNPLEDDPELDLGVGGQLKIPAFASLSAYITGGLALDVVVGKIEGGIGLKGTLRVEGGVFAKFDARYKKNRFTAELTPEIKGELILLLALTAYALAQAGWGWLSVKTRKDWKLGEKRVPTGIDFLLRAKFGYDSETGLRLPSVNEIELKKPEITKEKLGLIVERLFSSADAKEIET